MSFTQRSTSRSARLLTPRRLWLAAGAVAVAGAIATEASASGARATAAATTVTVRLQNIAFHPTKVVIKPGTTVKWIWLDADIDTQHNVTSLPGGKSFKSSKTMMSGTYSVKFTKPGTYKYECTIHPTAMQGVITVT